MSNVTSFNVSYLSKQSDVSSEVEDEIMADVTNEKMPEIEDVEVEEEHEEIKKTVNGNEVMNGASSTKILTYFSFFQV